MLRQNYRTLPQHIPHASPKSYFVIFFVVIKLCTAWQVMEALGQRHSLSPVNKSNHHDLRSGETESPSKATGWLTKSLQRHSQASVRFHAPQPLEWARNRKKTLRAANRPSFNSPLDRSRYAQESAAADKENKWEDDLARYQV